MKSEHPYRWCRVLWRIRDVSASLSSALLEDVDVQNTERLNELLNFSFQRNRKIGVFSKWKNQ